MSTVRCNYQHEDSTNVADVVALGKFDNTIELIVPKEKKPQLAVLKGHLGGITTLHFSKTDPYFLFSGARKDNIVYCWDIRNPKQCLSFFERKSQTNQRMHFDICH